MNKSPFITVLLAFIPGFGHLYLEKRKKFFFYLLIECMLGIGAIGALFLGIIPLMVVCVFLFGFVWFVQFIDVLITYSRLERENDVSDTAKKVNEERFYSIILSFVPGLGHFQLGLTYRGLTLLIVAFGFSALNIFIAFWLRNSSFLVFLMLLPIFWIYAVYDINQLLAKKERGEELIDASIFSDFEQTHSQEKNKFIAIILSLIPGLSQMYMGLQQRGFQLLFLFFGAIFIVDFLNVSILFLSIPLIWFFSFFDALQKYSEYKEGILIDEPVFKQFIHQKKWIGIGFILIGFYVLFQNSSFFLPARYVEILYQYEHYVQTMIASLILMGIGVYLLIEKRTEEKE